MNVIDFQAYKESKEVKYLDHEYVQDDVQSFAEEMDSMAEVMEMSTDEILGELSIRVNNDNKGMRDTATNHLVDELTQRLLAIEYILYLVMAQNTKK